jgi:4-carboxymuconolactone decarboxylase
MPGPYKVVGASHASPALISRCTALCAMILRSAQRATHSNRAGWARNARPVQRGRGEACLARINLAPRCVVRDDIWMDKALYEAGLEVRKATLGKEFVENAISSADDFNRPLQEFVTEYCWGACWTRPGLPRKTRSMLNLAMLTALNRPHELKMHIKGALTNGVTRDEIREILLQTGVYCGVPAAVDAFRSAKEVFAELDKK